MKRLRMVAAVVTAAVRTTASAEGEGWAGTAALARILAAIVIPLMTAAGPSGEARAEAAEDPAPAPRPVPAGNLYDVVTALPRVDALRRDTWLARPRKPLGLLQMKE